MIIAPRLLLAAVGVAGVGALALAAFLQHARGFEPCPWCVLQRLVVLVIVVAALAGASPPAGRRARSIVGAALAVLLAIGGLAAALYQHLVVAHSTSCALTAADRIISALHLAELWPAMFEATARCDEANMPWLGVPFALWGALTFMVLGLASAWAFWGARRSDQRDWPLDPIRDRY